MLANILTKHKFNLLKRVNFKILLIAFQRYLEQAAI